MMNKLGLESKNVIKENISKIEELFPSAVFEGKVDFEILKQELSSEVIDTKKEKYELTWPGKKEAIVIGNTPTKNTLRPLLSKSRDFNKTKNIYIEGDNLDTLKILQESYLNKIKCIYIDPPYNTGNDFIYNDTFKKDNELELIESGQTDINGNLLITNKTSNGRFHSDWLTMIYSRLKLCKNLLSQNGVIFISIDDKEQSNLKKICDEIFGEYNFVEQLIWKKRPTPPNDKNIGRIHEYILCYAKDIDHIQLGLLPRDGSNITRYSNPDDDPRGPWVASDLSANGKGGRIVQSCVYPILNPDNGKEYLPSEGRCWLFNKEKMDEWIKEGRVAFRNNTGAPFLKRYLSEVRDGITLPTILLDFGYSQTSVAEQDKLFKKKGIFEYAKPTTLIKNLIRIGAPNDNDIVLDFFSGSATTADAVMQLNAEDNKNRSYILVQLDEPCAEKSAAYQNGYKTICELGEDRIVKAAEKIKEELNANIDYGFRVYKVDTSNMKDVYYKPGEIEQINLMEYLSNIKEDRTPDDLLVQVMLDLGLPLDLKVEKKYLNNNNVFFVENNSLIACFDEQIDINIVDEICRLNPMKVVFKDTSFKSDKDKINLEEKIKKLSPDTEVSVL